MENEPWPIGFCPCPNGRYVQCPQGGLRQLLLHEILQNIFLSSNLRMAMILNCSLFFFLFQKAKLTYRNSPSNTSP